MELIISITHGCVVLIPLLALQYKCQEHYQLGSKDTRKREEEGGKVREKEKQHRNMRETGQKSEVISERLRGRDSGEIMLRSFMERV